jgi:hypothetical protein
MSESLTVASYGGGVNSTAMLIGMHAKGERVDLVLFADTGGETPDTMEYVAKFSRWLAAKGMPPIMAVRKTTKKAGRFRGANEELTLERMCLEQKVLPSVAYGMKSCSLKFKKEPQDEYLSAWTPAIDAWAAGLKVTKLIGFDAGEPWRQKDSPDPRFTNRFPLIEWGWDREECIEQIASAGLCVPPKSSCFFCPNMTEIEVLRLRDRHPDLMTRALEMEANAVATPGSTIKGLGRNVSWKQIIEYDATQMAFIPRSMPTLPCECWDGD